MEIIGVIEELKESFRGIKEDEENLRKIREENVDLRKNAADCVKKHGKRMEKHAHEAKLWQKNEREWNVQKAQYEEVIEALQKYIKQNETNTNSSEYLAFAQQISKSSEEIHSLHQKIQKMQSKLIKSQYHTGELKSSLLEKDKKLISLENSLKNLSISLESSNSSSEFFQSLYTLHTNQINMLNEDLQISQEFRKELKVYKDLTENLQQKINYFQSEKYLNEEDSIAVTLPDIFPVTSGTMADFQYSRPTFEEMLGVEGLTQAKYSPPFKHWVNLMIRGIYDSKFYEHSLCNSAINSFPSRFTDFVYSWISKFGIDETNRNVIELEWWKKDKANEIRFMFFLGLNTPKARNSWEISTFKSFLQEEMMLDELGFFLHCRYLILKSPQLATTIGKYSNVQMVNLDKVLEVQGLIMKKASIDDSAKLFMILKEKASKNKIVPTIDLAVALRILLEFYISEKKHKAALIRQLFEASPKGPNGKIEYFSFRSLCKSLNLDMAEYEITKFYRDCWSKSNGFISFEVFFLVANESCVLYNMLRLRGDISYSDLISLSGPHKSISNRHMQKMQKVLEEFKKTEKDLIVLKSGLDSMGIENISEKFSKFSHLLLSPSTCAIEDYWVWSLEDIQNRFWGLIISAQYAFLECNSQDIKLLAYKFRKDQCDILNLSTPHKATGYFLDILHSMNLTNISKTIAARKIQQSWKIKAGKNISLIATVMKSVKKFKGLTSKNK